MIDEGPGEHDRHLLDDDDADEDAVACPDCGLTVWSHAEQCPHCGVYFTGEAWRQQPAGGAMRIAPWWWVAVAVALIGLIALLTIGRVI